MKRFEVKFPCSEKEVVEANDIAKRLFGERNVTSDDHFLGLYRHNRLTALTLYDWQRRATVGYMDAYPVTQDYLDGLRDGKYYEDELTIDTVLPESETSLADCLYVAGIVVDDRLGGFDHAQAGACLLLAYFTYLETVLCSDVERRIRIGALAYTGDGARFLRKNGFDIIASETERGRKGDYFERTTVAKRGSFAIRRRKPLKILRTICDLSAVEKFRT
jgi:hypothetical protein